MDAKKLGTFIAERRKELGLTQASLAEKLHVTDKAISKWERGAGLPDIGNIEALAEALEVSLVELMQTKRGEKQKLSTEEAETIVLNTIQLSKTESDNSLVKMLGRITIGGFVIICTLLLIFVAMEGFREWWLMGSLGAGIISWVIPLWSFSFKRSRSMAASAVSSLGLAAASLMFCFFYISSEVYSGDFSALLDVTDTLVMVVVLYISITIILNVIAVKISKYEKKVLTWAVLILIMVLFFIMAVLLILMGSIVWESMQFALGRL